MLFSTYFGFSAGGPPAGDGPNGAWYYDMCLGDLTVGSGVQWFAYANSLPPAPPPSPAVPGASAASALSPPSPTLYVNPSGTGYVNLPEWLWIDSSIWHPITTSATACNAGGCTTSSATATPVSVTWNTGDGGSVTCPGPGNPYNQSLPTSQQSTDCSHTYTQSSIGQSSPDGNPNDAAFLVSATVTWDVLWSGPDGAGGGLPPITTESSTTLRVAQIESINN